MGASQLQVMLKAKEWKPRQLVCDGAPNEEAMKHAAAVAAQIIAKKMGPDCCVVTVEIKASVLMLIAEERELTVDVGEARTQPGDKPAVESED